MENEHSQSKRQKLLADLHDSEFSTEEIEDFINSWSKGISEAQFRQRYGMIEICSRMPSYDRFRSIQMNEETLSSVAYLVGSDVAYSTEFSGGKEHSILDRLARNLARFTKPLRPREEQPLYGTTDDELQKKADCAMDYLDAETEGRSVLKVSVFKLRHTLKGRRVKVVMHWKSGAGPEDLFQPAVTTVDALMPTAGHPKSFRPPVYLLAQDTRKWFYGILEIDGYIKVKQGKIDPATSDDFPVKPQQVDTRKFTPSRTRDEVEAQFEKWTADMARNDMYVPDGCHPVGRLFIPLTQRDEAPSVSADQTLTIGRKRYFDGMLKILVGCRVIKWTPDDAIDAWNARSYLEKALRTSGLPEKYWCKVLGRG